LANFKLIAQSEEKYQGIPASRGIAMGSVYVYNVHSPSFETNVDSEVSIETEISEYFQAIEQSKKELNKVFGLAKEKLDEKNLQIFEAQLTFLNDDVLHRTIIKRIKSEHSSAYRIFNDEIKSIESRLLSSKDEYLRERVNDLEDIKNRVLRNITKKKLVSKIQENAIVIARNLTPADTILFSNRKMLGLATDLGGTNSHVAIIARSLNIPAVVGMKNVSVHVNTNDFIILDAYGGCLIKNPDEKTIQSYKRQIATRLTIVNLLKDVSDRPAKTKDGKLFKLSVNLEFDKEVDFVRENLNCSVGLYRTEHLFLEKGDFPTEEEQYQNYKMLAEKIFPNEVTIRTFDIGGDKILPDTQKELNPFLGWRGIRICLDKKDIFLSQLTAILRASEKKNVRIMFPMIASLDEVIEAKKLLEQAKSILRKQKIKFDNKIKIGIMIEVPSSIYIADSLAKEVDFFSIGTNDLIQYTLAVDRDSSLVSSLYQKFHPAVIRSLQTIINYAKKNHVQVSVCGEMAGDIYAGLMLIGMGVDELSVETSTFLEIKNQISKFTLAQLKNISSKVLSMDKESQIRKFLSTKLK